jgi:ferric-dicitrate binding protein FerR (iron transport regulator)
MNHNLYESLIVDPSFISWVHSDFEESDSKWSDFIDENPDDYETINKAIYTIRSFRGETFTFPQKQELLSKIEKSIGAEVISISSHQRFPVKKILAYAASLTAILVFALYFIGKKEYISETGKQLLVTLPDQSRVTLNAHATLRFNTMTWGFKRSVELEGEGFFEVAKGEKFDVNTKNGNVQVLGTSFNVDSRQNHFQVFCYTGKVAVSDLKSQQKFTLSPYEGVQIENGMVTKLSEQNKLRTEPFWKSGQEYFEEVALKNVVVDIQKYFEQKINVSPDIENIRLTGYVPTDNFETALQHITWPLELQYKKDKNQVYIYK